MKNIFFIAIAIICISFTCDEDLGGTVYYINNSTSKNITCTFYPLDDTVQVNSINKLVTIAPNQAIELLKTEDSNCGWYIYEGNVDSIKVEGYKDTIIIMKENLPCSIPSMFQHYNWIQGQNSDSEDCTLTYFFK